MQVFISCFLGNNWYFEPEGQKLNLSHFEMLLDFPHSSTYFWESLKHQGVKISDLSLHQAFAETQCPVSFLTHASCCWINTFSCTQRPVSAVSRPSFSGVNNVPVLPWGCRYIWGGSEPSHALLRSSSGPYKVSVTDVYSFGFDLDEVEGLEEGICQILLRPIPDTLGP